jgi:polyisoprenoid-binding protein YceI
MMVNAKVMCRTALLFLLFACSWHTAALADSRYLLFGPPFSKVAFRAYKLGLLPVDGNFRQFTGRLTYEPSDHSKCRVDLQIDAASLATEDPAMRTIVAGPDFLDVTDFPSLAYTGTCEGHGIQGTLGMHGVNGPFELEVTWTDSEVQAAGRLLRAAWGMTALPALAGRTIRIEVSIPLTK